MKTEDIWQAGKIDLIKFITLMSELHQSDEKEEAKKILDWLGIKYSDLD